MTEREFWELVIRHLMAILEALRKFKLNKKQPEADLVTPITDPLYDKIYVEGIKAMDEADGGI